MTDHAPPDHDIFLADAWQDWAQPCQHLWQRDAVESGKDRPQTSDRHYRCARCKTTRADRWNGESWDLYIGATPPERPKVAKPPATMRDRGRAAAENMRPRVSEDAEWLAGYDEQAQQMKKPWGLPPLDPTDTQSVDTMSPEAQRDHVLAARERSRRLSGG